MGALRILIADDHDLMLRGIRTIIESHEGWTICGEVHNGREAIAKASELKPDIAILDISMPDVNGLVAIGKIRKASPNTEILILSVHHSEQLILEILKAGARGYIVKSDSDRDLVLAVEALAVPLNPVARVVLSQRRRDGTLCIGREIRQIGRRFALTGLTCRNA